MAIREPGEAFDPAEIRRGRVEANGISISYLESGPPDAGHTILFLHGGTGSAHRHWSGQLEDFGARGYRCLAPDHRGHAGTTNDRSGLDQALMAEDEAEFLRVLGVGRAHVVGFSVGGVIAIYLALAHPELVASLVTIGSHMTVDEHVRASNLTIIPETVEREEPDWAEQLRLLHGQAAVSDVAGVHRRPEYWRDLLTWIYETWERQPNWTDAELGRIGCPTLIGRGQFDDRAVQVQIDRMAAPIPGANTFVVQGAGHYFHTSPAGRRSLDRLLSRFLPPANG